MGASLQTIKKATQEQINELIQKNRGQALVSQGIAVAFAGGGFRAFAEVAVLEELERRDIKIKAVAGTSMGSLVAALAASGAKASRVAEILCEMDEAIVAEGVLEKLPFKLLNLVKDTGLVDCELLERHARVALEKVGIRTFADFKIPIAITAVHAETGELHVFCNESSCFEGEVDQWKLICKPELEVAKVCAASGSYPLVISSAELEGEHYLDGGCRMNLPTPLFERAYFDACLGIGMRRPLSKVDELNAFSITLRTIQSAMAQLELMHARAADLYINLNVAGDDAFQAGTGRAVIEEAREMLATADIDWSALDVANKNRLRSTMIDKVSNFFRKSGSL